MPECHTQGAPPPPPLYLAISGLSLYPGKKQQQKTMKYKEPGRKNYPAIRGPCHIRPLHNEAQLYKLSEPRHKEARHNRTLPQPGHPAGPGSPYLRLSHPDTTRNPGHPTQGNFHSPKDPHTKRLHCTSLIKLIKIYNIYIKLIKINVQLTSHGNSTAIAEQDLSFMQHACPCGQCL